MKVEIYWNLHRKCWSIRHKGKVIGYANSVLIKLPTFKVSEKSRQRVIQTGVKNVHAFVVGEIISTNSSQPIECSTEVYYNPRKTQTFVKKENNEMITRAQLAYLGSKVVHVYEG